MVPVKATPLDASSTSYPVHDGIDQDQAYHQYENAGNEQGDVEQELLQELGEDGDVQGVYSCHDEDYVDEPPDQGIEYAFHRST